MTQKKTLPFLKPTRPPTTDQVPGSMSGHIDHAVVALGGLILTGWLASPGDLNAVTISLPGLTRHTLRIPFARYRRDDVDTVLQQAQRTRVDRAGFVCVLEFEPSIAAAVEACRKSDQLLSLQIETHTTEVVHGKVKLQSLREAMASGVLTEAIIEILAKPPGNEASRLRGEMIASLANRQTLRCHIDTAHTADGQKVLFTGWAEGAEGSSLWLCDASLASAPMPLDAVVTPREDVARHLSDQGAIVTTDRYGITAVARVDGRSKVRLCQKRGREVLWSHEMELDARKAPLRSMIGTCLATALHSGREIARDHTLLARAIVDQEPPPPPDVSHVRVFEPEGSGIVVPRVSIVIPFYAETFYLLDHIMAQRRAPSDVEWIFVCDDPRLTATLIAMLVHRQTLLRQRSTLVLLAANGGFAHANNIGVKYAQGEFVLLMNSDIWCAEFSFLDYATRLLDSRPDIGCTGFSLQFEDGTVQHDGMSFRRAPWMDNLWASEHPGKGMPHTWSNPTHIEVPAVTAALMLLRKRDISESGVFDPGYLIGDFEDADLCLRMREDGKKIALVRCDGIYHLERQSVRHVGDDNSRRGITLLNSARFNDKWGRILDAMASGVAK